MDKLIIGIYIIQAPYTNYTIGITFTISVNFIFEKICKILNLPKDKKN